MSWTCSNCHKEIPESDEFVEDMELNSFCSDRCFVLFHRDELEEGPRVVQ